MSIDKQVNELQQVEIKMLEKFVEVCSKLKLKYYLLAGTLLGAVRHKGFIPWDDDIDVGMPREDYEIFVKEAQKLLPEHYFIQTFETDPNYPANFAKIRDNNTTFIESSVRNLQMNHGAYIDIFPLDEYPDKNIKWFNFRHKYYTMCIYKGFNLEKKKKLKQFIARVLTMFTSVKKAVVKRERLYKQSKGKKFLINFSGAWGDREITPSEWYGKGVDVQFENLTVKAPDCWDLWLTQVYGDYMQLPPEEKRVSHHYSDMIDCNSSYKNYIFNKGEWVKNSVNAKENV